MMSEFEFIQQIVQTLREHPDWHKPALDAISQGMAEALKKANDRAAGYDIAFRSALALVNSSRLTDESREMLNKTIVRHIDPVFSCETEREFITRWLHTKKQ